MAYGRMISGSRIAISSRTRSARVPRVSRLRWLETPPNWRARSTRTTLSGRRRAADTAMLVAMVVVPTPPFGLKTAIVRRARAIVRPSAE